MMLKDFFREASIGAPEPWRQRVGQRFTCD